MSDKKYICSSCGKILKENQKFCTVCGTKNEFIEYIEQDNDSNFSVNLNDNTNVDIDNKNFVENSSVATKINTNEELENKKSKILNKKTKICLSSIAILLIVVFFALKIYAMVNPNYVPIKAFYNTYKNISKLEKKYLDSNILYNLYNNGDKIKENEVQLCVSGIDIEDGGVISQGLKDVLKNYVLTIKNQYGKDKLVSFFNINLKNHEADIIDGDIYYDKEKIIFDFPDLLIDTIGIRNKYNPQENIIESSKDFYNDEELKKIEEFIINQNKKYIKYYENEINFKKIDNNKYTAILDSSKFTKITEGYILDLLNNEYIENLAIRYMMYVNNGYSNKYCKDYYDSIKLELSDFIKELISEEYINDINLNITIEDSIVKFMSIDTSIVDSNDEQIEIYFESYVEKQKDNTDISYRLDVGSYGDIKIFGSTLYKNNRNDLGKKTEVNFIIDDTKIDINVEDKYRKNKNFDQNIVLNFSSYDEFMTFNCFYKLEKENNNTININNLHINISDNDVSASIDLYGYLKSREIDKMKTIDDKKITYIDELSAYEIEDIYYNLYENLESKFMINLNRYEL